MLCSKVTNWYSYPQIIFLLPIHLSNEAIAYSSIFHKQSIQTQAIINEKRLFNFPINRITFSPVDFLWAKILNTVLGSAIYHTTTLFNWNIQRVSRKVWWGGSCLRRELHSLGRDIDNWERPLVENEKIRKSHTQIYQLTALRQSQYRFHHGLIFFD